MKLHRYPLRFQILHETLLKCWLMTRDIRRLGGGRFIHLVKYLRFITVIPGVRGSAFDFEFFGGIASTIYRLVI